MKRSRLPISLLAFTLSLAAASWAPVIGATGQHPTQSKHHSTRDSKGNYVPVRGELGQELFLATVTGNLQGVQSLLKRGADPDARNSLDMTPLFLASGMGQTKIMGALLNAGAKLEPETPYGPPLMNACLAGAVPAIQFLLSHGAKVDVTRPDGITPLMLVSRGGLTPIAAVLLKRKLDVNAADNDGATALMYAAREGQAEVGRVLLAAGAKVDAADSHGWTPLTFAAVTGHTEFVRLLLEKGANPNIRDAMGRTPLLLTASYGDHPDVVQALLQAGADAKAADGRKQNAYTLAAARGHSGSAKLLAALFPAPAEQDASGAHRTVREALSLSVQAIGRGMGEFNRLTGCVSCHHEGLGQTASGVAAQHGFLIPADVEQAYHQRVMEQVEGLRAVHLQALKNPAEIKRVPLIEMGDTALYYGYVLAGMDAHQQPPDEATGAMAMVLARQQLPDGSWMFGLPRVPMESSNFTMTALSIHALRAYGPKAYMKEIDNRIAKARSWMLKTPARENEDRAFRLLGLKWAGASSEERRNTLRELLAGQRLDGGWSQLASLQSDAYATGQALYALHVGGGLSTSDPAYQRGIQFLLRTQEEDGSWYVTKRATPANNYFDAGFPHGVSQFSSFNATCWATMAMAQGVERNDHIAMGH